MIYLCMSDIMQHRLPCHKIQHSTTSLQQTRSTMLH